VRRLVFSVVCCAALLALSVPADGQELASASEARFRLGPLGLQPRFKVTNVGIDSNVLNAAQNPVQDFTATFVPQVDNILPVGRVRLTGRTSVGFVYFATLAEQRSIDFSQQEKLTLQLTHVTPHAAVAYINSDQRPNQEIDARVHRTQTTWGGGLSAHLAPKVSVDFSGSQDQYEFADVDYRGVSLATVLDRTTRVIGGKIAVDLTPLTTFGIQAKTGQDRFPTAPERNADHSEVSAGVNLKRSALLSGTASVGVKWFRPHEASLQDYTGLIADVGLTYLFRDRTQLTGTVGRGTDYSFEVEHPYYISTGIGVSITQMLVGHTDVVGRLSRMSFDYRSFAAAGSSVPTRVDKLQSFGFGVGYRMSAGARIGVDLSYDRRISPVADRQYQGFRLGGSFIYGY
jgi:hypothetical protein